MYELRLRPKQPRDTAPGAFHWSVIRVVDPDPGDDSGNETIVGGGDDDLQGAARAGVVAFQRILTTPEGPVRHEEECSCGAALVVECRRSKKSPYSWDSLRELTCGCGRTFGVKLSFDGNPGMPKIALLYRTCTT